MTTILRTAVGGPTVGRPTGRTAAATPADGLESQRRCVKPQRRGRTGMPRCLYTESSWIEGFKESTLSIFLF